MNKKLAVSIIVTAVIYTLVMICFGVFGSAIQAVMLPICLTALKWVAVIAGYAIAVFLPTRIFNALMLNQQRQKIHELEEQVAAAEAEKHKEALRQRDVEEAILKSYMKEEDDV